MHEIDGYERLVLARRSSARKALGKTPGQQTVCDTALSNPYSVSAQTLITGDLLQFRGGSSTENVSECSYAYLLWAMTNTQLLLARVPATIGKTMRKAAARPPLRRERLGRGHRRVRYPLRRVTAQFNLHKTGQVALPIIEKLAELLGQLRGR